MRVRSGDIGRWLLQRTGRQRTGRRAALPLLVLWLTLMTLAVTGCGATTSGLPQLPGNTYTSAAYHFSVTYPSGWLVNEEDDQASAIFPLTIIVTRSGTTATDGSLVSNLTIAILDLRNTQALDKDLLKTVTSRATDSTYHAIRLAGHTAYATDPVQQAIYGTSQSATHTDYYVEANQFEYHISTDVIADDNADAAIQGMLSSLTITS
jgi:hypothetical protein